MSGRKNLQLLSMLLGLTWLAGGCVRMSEPERFICNSDADCEGEERCPRPGFYCESKDYVYCDVYNECPKYQHCDSFRCVDDECTPATAASDCNGYACHTPYCWEDCYYDTACASGFHCERPFCVPGAPDNSLVNDSACTKDSECRSGHCCAQPSGNVCLAFCPVECQTDGECGFDVCVDQRCVPRSSLKQGGVACAANQECMSRSCTGGVCRGTTGLNGACDVDTDCETGRLCCPNLSNIGDRKTCGEVDRSCTGSIGDACTSDLQCIDADCSGTFTRFCTKPCTSSAECGMNPWGVPNACERYGSTKICFPGCTSAQQCLDNLGGLSKCQKALDSSAMICAD